MLAGLPLDALTGLDAKALATYVDVLQAVNRTKGR